MSNMDGLHDYQEMIVQIKMHEGLCELLKSDYGASKPHSHS